jgi:hypothetical protein
MNYIKSIPKRVLAAMLTALLFLLLAAPVVVAQDKKGKKAKKDDIPTLSPTSDTPGTSQLEKIGGGILYLLEFGLALAVAVGVGTMAWRFFFGSPGEGGVGKSLGITALALVGLGILTDLHGFTAGWTTFLGF